MKKDQIAPLASHIKEVTLPFLSHMDIQRERYVQGAEVLQNERSKKASLASGGYGFLGYATCHFGLPFAFVHSLITKSGLPLVGAIGAALAFAGMSVYRSIQEARIREEAIVPPSDDQLTEANDLVFAASMTWDEAMKVIRARSVPSSDGDRIEPTLKPEHSAP